MTEPHRDPSDVALWRDVVREASTLENLRPHDGLIQQIVLGPETVGFTLLSGERFTVPVTADRNVIAAGASAATGSGIEANQAPEWAPPERTENFWWAETLYNFGMLAPEAIVMKPDVVFHRVWREGPLAGIEASDSHGTATATFDLRDPSPPADTVGDVLDALRRARPPAEDQESPLPG